MSACVPADATESAHTERAHPRTARRTAAAPASASRAPTSRPPSRSSSSPSLCPSASRSPRARPPGLLLVAAAVGGLVAGRLGGSPLQVSGPAAGLTVVTADLIHQYGWRVTCAVTVLAGLVQLGLSCLRVARGALAVSPAIVHGMLA